MDQNQNLLSSDLQVDIIAAGHLKETAMWAKFIGILGMLVSVLIAVMGLFAGTMLATMSRNFGGESASMGALGSGMLTVFYLIIAGVYFFLSLFLFRFATKMKQALQLNDQDNFNTSLLNLKLVIVSWVLS